MVTKKRLEEIRNSPNYSEIAERELEECIEEGNRMSEENRRLFQRLLN